MGTRVTVRLVSLVLLLGALFVPAVAFEVQAQQRDQALPGCGICYPGGYDLNTVGSVHGTVMELQVPDEGPVRIALDAEGERWVVLASPVWHWRTSGLRLTSGSGVTVRGSKTLGSDGTLYLVAQEIRHEGKGAVIFLRDGRGRPLWSADHHGGGNPGRSRAGGRRMNDVCRP